MSAKTPKRPKSGKAAIRMAVDNAEPVTPIDAQDYAQDFATDQNQFADNDDGNGSSKAADDLPPRDINKLRECADMDQNDRDNARRLIAWFGDDMLYVAGLGWMTWRDTHWQRDEGELQSRFKAQELVDKIKLEVFFIQLTPDQQKMVEAAERAASKSDDAITKSDKLLIVAATEARDNLRKSRTARRKFAVGTGNATRTSAMLTQAASQKLTDQDILDGDLNAFNVLNGTLKFAKVEDLECPDPDVKRYMADVRFEPHNRDDMITKRAEVTYDPGATCPNWLAYLERAHPSPDVRRFLQVFHAYAILQGGNPEQKLLYHYGPGGEGKTTLTETLGRLCGQYRAVVSPETFVGDQNRQGQQASPDIARLFGARFATIDELPRGVPLRENLIKAVSGGTRLAARFLMREIFEFEPIFVAVLTGNEMPEISGTDEGIWRRVLLVHWTVKIDAAERRGFGEILEMFDQERPGILNWLIEGLRLYLANGLEVYIPDSVRDFTRDYREERDPVGQFVTACVAPAPGLDPRACVQAAEMFTAYQRWSEANGLKAWQQTAFGRRMSAL